MTLDMYTNELLYPYETLNFNAKCIISILFETKR